MDPGGQTIDAARQLQHDACLLTSNLNILDQYVLCLQGTASKILELVVGRHDFLSTVMESRRCPVCAECPFTWKLWACDALH